MNRARFQNDVGPGGALYVGSPDWVAVKIADTVTTLGLGRFDLKYPTGTLSHEAMMQSIELYGTEVVPGSTVCSTHADGYRADGRRGRRRGIRWEG